MGEAAAAAELGCPASLAELQLLTELLALLEPPPSPSLGPTAISVVPRLPGPQSYLTHAVNHPLLLSDHLKDSTQAFDSQVKPA